MRQHRPLHIVVPLHFAELVGRDRFLLQPGAIDGRQRRIGINADRPRGVLANAGQNLIPFRNRVLIGLVARERKRRH